MAFSALWVHRRHHSWYCAVRVGILAGKSDDKLSWEYAPAQHVCSSLILAMLAVLLHEWCLLTRKLICALSSVWDSPSIIGESILELEARRQEGLESVW